MLSTLGKGLFGDIATSGLGREMSILWVVPFAMLLLAIAVLPLLTPHFWERNRSKAVVAAICGIPSLVYIGMLDLNEVLVTAHDYISFIVLLAALFIVSGGIHIKGDLRATPWVNGCFLLAGAILANLIGTTGASMVLIRPVLRTNKERLHTRHIPVFFIFLVSNIGGLLLPIGDPPLFLGYLEGVPFFWTLRLLPLWLVTVGLVLAVFLVVDTLSYRREPAHVLKYDRVAVQPLRIEGGINLLWLLGVLIAAIGMGSPLREFTMVLMALASWVTTKAGTRQLNEFTFHPIIEVAVLFAGIFASMIPALLVLKARGGDLGITQAWQFFWATGALSSFLDNAPTYLTFLSLAEGVTSALNLPAEIMLRTGAVAEQYLVVISVGAVFMGANTYIGNAPNFMVKAIAEEWRVKMPSFFGYMAWSAAVLLPIFGIVTLLFFR